MPYLRDEIPEPKTERLFNGHNSWIWRLALSPDGKTLAGGGALNNNRIHLWEVSTGKVLGVLDGYRNGVTGLGFSNDGGSLYSASLDGTMRLWDLCGQAETILTSYESFRALAIARDGTLAVGGDNAMLYLFQPGALKAELLTVVGKIRSITFSRDGQNLAVGTDAGILHILVNIGGSWKQLRKHMMPATVLSLAFTPDNESMACGTSLGNVYRINIIKGTCQRVATLPTRQFCSMLFTDEETLLIGQTDPRATQGSLGSGQLAVFSWLDWQLLKSFEDFNGGLNALIQLNDGRLLITPKNRTKSLAQPDCFYPALLNFGDVNLGRGEKFTIDGAPPWLRF